MRHFIWFYVDPTSLHNFYVEAALAAAKKKKAGKSAKPDFKWIALIFLTTVLISALMSFVSSNLLEGAGLALSFVILICIVLTGILFDIIGVAVTAADEVPFHAMASRKVPEAEDALLFMASDLPQALPPTVTPETTADSSSVIKISDLLLLKISTRAAMTAAAEQIGKDFSPAQKAQSRILHTVAENDRRTKVLRPAEWPLVERSEPIAKARSTESVALKIIDQTVRSDAQLPKSFAIGSV